MKSLFLMMAAAAFTTAGTAAQCEEFTMKVNGDFQEDELSWNTMGKAYEFRWLVFERGGQLAVCGVGKYVDVSNKSQTIDLMRKGKVLLDGKPILKDLTFFARVKSTADLASATASCKDTGAKAGPDSRVRLDVSGRARF